MSTTIFRFYLLVLFGCVALSAMEIPGAMLGLILGVAFMTTFAALSILLQTVGIPATVPAVGAVFLALYALIIVRQAQIAWWAQQEERYTEARWYFARAILFASFPIMGRRSIDTLTEVLLH